MPLSSRPYPDSPLHLAASEYVSLPWKAGRGTTEEICLLPESATREAFGLRISSAPILEPGVFSAFSGVDRVITLIEGPGLALEFGDRTVRLDPLCPYRFDSGLTPDGRPLGGAGRVVNVMAARSRWSIAAARVALGPFHAEAPGDGMAVVFAISEDWQAGERRIGQRDTLILSAGIAADFLPAAPGPSAALEVVLTSRA